MASVVVSRAAVLKASLARKLRWGLALPLTFAAMPMHAESILFKLDEVDGTSQVDGRTAYIDATNLSFAGSIPIVIVNGNAETGIPSVAPIELVKFSDVSDAALFSKFLTGGPLANGCVERRAESGAGPGVVVAKIGLENVYITSFSASANGDGPGLVRLTLQPIKFSVTTFTVDPQTGQSTESANVAYDVSLAQIDNVAVKYGNCD